jgi:hypothetical protein
MIAVFLLVTCLILGAVILGNQLCDDASDTIDKFWG